VGVKFTPVKEFAVRGTYSQGFRAPTFAEAGPRSQYAGFVTITPPGAFCAQHGGSSTPTGACSNGGNPYNFQYSVGRGFAGNPDLEPEKSRSFTAGVIFQPAKWFSATVDYYNVKKSNLVANGPLAGAAITACGAGSSDAATGIQSSGESTGTMPVNDGGATPTIVNGVPRMRSVTISTSLSGLLYP